MIRGTSGLVFNVVLIDTHSLKIVRICRGAMCLFGHHGHLSNLSGARNFPVVSTLGLALHPPKKNIRKKKQRSLEDSFAHFTLLLTLIDTGPDLQATSKKYPCLYKQGPAGSALCHSFGEANEIFAFLYQDRIAPVSRN